MTPQQLEQVFRAGAARAPGMQADALLAMAAECGEIAAGTSVNDIPGRVGEAAADTVQVAVGYAVAIDAILRDLGRDPDDPEVQRIITKNLLAEETLPVVVIEGDGQDGAVRAAALRVRGGISRPGDAEVLAEYVEQQSRDRPVGEPAKRLVTEWDDDLERARCPDCGRLPGTPTAPCPGCMDYTGERPGGA